MRGRAFAFSDFATVPLAMALTALLCSPNIKSVTAAVAGVLAWTFIEYWMHRTLHVRSLKRLRAFHMLHHQVPASPSGGTLYSTLIISALVAAAFVWRDTAPFLLGVLAGYLWFIVLHHLLHHVVNLDGLVLRELAKNHEIHHHDGPSRMFGVSTSLWDHVFGTA